MASPDPQVVFLYGSQTGCAKSICEALFARATAPAAPAALRSARLAPLNDFAEVDLPAPVGGAPQLAVIVCSTTGDGDAPNNAESFLRFVRRRTQPKALLAGLRFALLGLGDTNYDKFCNAAKQLAKRLPELGAQPLVAPAFADEAVGLESVVDPWTSALWPQLLAACGAYDVEAGAAAGTGTGAAGADAPGLVSPSLTAAVVAHKAMPLPTHTHTHDGCCGPNSPLSFIAQQQAVEASRREARDRASTAATGGRSRAGSVAGPASLQLPGAAPAPAPPSPLTSSAAELAAAAASGLALEARFPGSRGSVVGSGGGDGVLLLHTHHHQAPSHTHAPSSTASQPVQLPQGGRRSRAASLAGLVPADTVIALDTAGLRPDELLEAAARAAAAQAQADEVRARATRELERTVDAAEAVAVAAAAAAKVAAATSTAAAAAPVSGPAFVSVSAPAPAFAPAAIPALHQPPAHLRAQAPSQPLLTVTPGVQGFFELFPALALFALPAVAPSAAAPLRAAGAGLAPPPVIVAATLPRVEESLRAKPVPPPTKCNLAVRFLPPEEAALYGAAEAALAATGAGAGAVTGPGGRLDDSATVSARSAGLACAPSPAPAPAAAFTPPPPAASPPLTPLLRPASPALIGASPGRHIAGPATGAPAPPSAPASFPAGLGRSVEAPLSARVVGARYLTAGGPASERRVVHVELDVGGSPLAGAWQPGDSIGVVAPNGDALCLGLCARLGLDPLARVELLEATPAAQAASAAAAAHQALGAGAVTAPTLASTAASSAAGSVAAASACSASPALSLGGGGGGGEGGGSAVGSPVAARASPTSSPALSASPLVGAAAALPVLAAPSLALPPAASRPPPSSSFTATSASSSSSSSSARSRSASPGGSAHLGTKEPAGPSGGPGSGPRARCPLYLPQWLPGYPCPTLLDVLRWCVDLTGTMRKALLRLLAEHAMLFAAEAPTDAAGVAVTPEAEAERERDARCLMFLACGAGRTHFTQLVEDQRLTLLDLLLLFPQSRPPLAPLLAALSPLAPRSYSLVTSPLASRATMAFAFTAVEYECAAGTGVAPGGSEASPFGAPTPALSAALSAPARPLIRRFGLATAWLEHSLCRPFLLGPGADEAAAAAAAAASASAGAVRILLRPSRDFNPPLSLQTPLVMIGPGTGVAPFVGFLQHRAWRAAKLRRDALAVTCGHWRPDCFVRGLGGEAEAAAALGPALLFFGNRRRDVDFLYEAELTVFLAEGALMRLHTAWSREGAAGAPKVYVQQRLREEAAAVADLVLRRGAHIYVCGDGMRMAKDVHAALADALVAGGALGPAEAESLLLKMSKEGRYARDVW